MEKETINKTLVERLRRCPKIECNFLSRRNYDDDVSEITFEEGLSSSLLYLAAKRFETNVNENFKPSDNLPTALYDEDRLVEPLRCSDNDKADAIPDVQIPQSPINDNFHDMELLTSLYIPCEDFDVDRKPDNEIQMDGGIPKLEPICDKDNSFSSSSTNNNMIFRQNDGVESASFCETEEMDHLCERIVDTSGLPSSFNAPNENENSINSRGVLRSRTSRNQDHSNKFSDVKTAKSLNLFVDEYPQTSFFSLLDSLQSNRAIERIVIFRKGTTNKEIRTRTLDDMDDLFDVIRNLSKSLVELVLCNFHPEDLSSFCLGIGDHPSIGYLQLHMEHGTLDQQSMQIIASMPSLVSLELEVNKSFPVWSLLESDSLVLFGVVSTRFDFTPNDVIRLASRIRTNSVLKVLDLEPRIPSWCMGAVMASLRFSHISRLETFRFSCQNDNNEDQGDACMAEILKTIEYDTPLRMLWNHSHECFSVSAEMRRKTLSAVSRNPSLEQFSLFAENEE